MAYASGSSLGVQLRRLRTSQGLSLDEAARRAGVSKAALSAWEIGTRRPRGPALVRLLVALGADERTQARLLRLADPQHARIALADSAFGSVDVGTVLRAMRERRGIAQADLARRLGVAQSTVSRWEAGDDVPSPEAVHALGFTLGASVEETLALASSLGQGEGGLPDDPEDTVARIWEEAHYDPLRGLQLLGWEAELARRALRDARWDPALASVLSARACLLLVESRQSEVPQLAERAIRLAGTVDARLQAVPALGVLDHALRRMGRDDAATTELAETWAGLLPDSPARAWMLRLRGLAFVRRGRVAEGLQWVERSSDVELQARPEHPEPWSHRAEMLAHAHLEAGDPRGAAAVVGGRRERRFPSELFVRIEHANGRPATEAEMAWLRFRTRRERWPHDLRGIEGIERRQARLTGGPPSAWSIPDDPGAEERLWGAVQRENAG